MGKSEVIPDSDITKAIAASHAFKELNHFFYILSKESKSEEKGLSDLFESSLPFCNYFEKKEQDKNEFDRRSLINVEPLTDKNIIIYYQDYFDKINNEYYIRLIVAKSLLDYITSKDKKSNKLKDYTNQMTNENTKIEKMLGNKYNIWEPYCIKYNYLCLGKSSKLIITKELSVSLSISEQGDIRTKKWVQRENNDKEEGILDCKVVKQSIYNKSNNSWKQK